LRWLQAREPIPAGLPNAGLGARVEPVTRALGLPVGALRTGASLVRRGRAALGPPEPPEEERRYVALDRRAA
jgi:hypothetical protein